MGFFFQIEAQFSNCTKPDNSFLRMMNPKVLLYLLRRHCLIHKLLKWLEIILVDEAQPCVKSYLVTFREAKEVKSFRRANELIGLGD